MTAREINQLTRDGGNGRNAYLHCAAGVLRVTSARNRGGVLQVRLLFSGRWVAVAEGERVEASL